MSRPMRLTLNQSDSTLNHNVQNDNINVSFMRGYVNLCEVISSNNFPEVYIMKFNKQLLTLSFATACVASAVSVHAMEETFATRLRATASAITCPEVARQVCCRNYLLVSQKLENKVQDKQAQLKEVMDAWLSFINAIPKQYAQPAHEQVKIYTEWVKNTLVNGQFDLTNQQQRSHFNSNMLPTWQSDADVALTIIATADISDQNKENSNHDADTTTKITIKTKIIDAKETSKTDGLAFDDTVQLSPELTDFINKITNDTDKAKSNDEEEETPETDGLTFDDTPQITSIVNNIVKQTTGGDEVVIKKPENEAELETDAAYVQCLLAKLSDDTLTEAKIVKSINIYNQHFTSRMGSMLNMFHLGTAVNIRKELLKNVQRINQECTAVEQAYGKINCNDQDVDTLSENYQNAKKSLESLLKAITTPILEAEKVITDLTNNGSKTDLSIKEKIIKQLVLENLQLLPYKNILNVLQRIVPKTFKEINALPSDKTNDTLQEINNDIAKIIADFHAIVVATINEEIIPAALINIFELAHNDMTSHNAPQDTHQ